jgi:hypothetical protein
MISRRRFVAACGCALWLPACGGGGNDDLQGNDTSDAATRDALQRNGGYGLVQPFDPVSGTRVLVRWETPIPVKTEGDAEAIAAIDTIEAQLGRTIFDRTSIAATPDDRIAAGIVVRRGVAGCLAGSQSCGSVSGLPDPVGTVPAPISARPPLGVMRARLVVALGGRSADGRLLPSNLDVAIHEFGHALGFPGHFPGFGTDDLSCTNCAAISPLFWRVLRTTYSNPPGTPLARVTLAP